MIKNICPAPPPILVKIDTSLQILVKYHFRLTAEYCSSKVTEIHVWMTKISQQLTGLNLD